VICSGRMFSWKAKVKFYAPHLDPETLKLEFEAFHNGCWHGFWNGTWTWVEKENEADIVVYIYQRLPEERGTMFGDNQDDMFRRQDLRTLTATKRVIILIHGQSPTVAQERESKKLNVELVHMGSQKVSVSNAIQFFSQSVIVAQKRWCCRGFLTIICGVVCVGLLVAILFIYPDIFDHPKIVTDVQENTPFFSNSSSIPQQERRSWTWPDWPWPGWL